jgi:hypothetical protein
MMRLLPDFVTYPGSLGLFLGLCAFGGAVLWLLIGFAALPLWLSIALTVLYVVCVAVAWLVIAWPCMIERKR